MTELFDCRDPSQRSRGIASAVKAVKSGRLVVMPTDTVYGIGADAFDSSAVAALLAAKGAGATCRLVCWLVPGRQSTDWPSPCRRPRGN
ncbi:telomere recombination family protein [Mycobacterium xenopi 4042]|uniref:Telomere recombination family protein n=1 Tax=Mycobacterium xenopi 4042 TaxID=1299334 RepID=X8DZU1_MYCXE|nr:telomere recombination family protein [Mycobacterium xenopi 4042]